MADVLVVERDPSGRAEMILEDVKLGTQTPLGSFSEKGGRCQNEKNRNPVP
jgi:hypothetical protein